MNRIGFSLFFLLLTGCATIVNQGVQQLALDTGRVTGAKCELTDSKGERAYVMATPGMVMVKRGGGPMTVVCSKRGFTKVETVVEEGFSGVVLGNVLLGGGVGLIVDAVSGSAQEYPGQVTVWMEPERFKNAREEKEWLEAREEYLAKIRKLEEQQAKPPERSIAE
ncbi:MAG: hypothetical protein HQL57_03980 [Magnetococcales bacterium]|nr:hypothetical protein [Magnetococcales bacterium]